jgi:perosamine synthetase
MRPENDIPVASPALIGREREYVDDCMRSSWISSAGTYIERFEEAFAAVCGVQHGVACSSGTSAIHLAVKALAAGPGDEVIVPTLTFVASANPVVDCGALPVFVDSERDTWNLDPSRVAEAITPRTVGIVVVHLYGHPTNMGPIMELAERHGLWVVEDAAEAHGAEYMGRMVGSIGHAATFSFYGNKIITTGEGGMVLTDDDSLAAKMRILRGQGQDPERRYWFGVHGFNYRMTNVAAAIGLAQTERFDWHVERRRENASWYKELLSDNPLLDLSPEMDWARSTFWMTSALVSADAACDRDALISTLAAEGIETRPFFHPMHTLPMYRDGAASGDFPVADDLALRGINLPSGALLSRHDVERVCCAISTAVGKANR